LNPRLSPSCSEFPLYQGDAYDVNPLKVLALPAEPQGLDVDFLIFF